MDVSDCIYPECQIKGDVGKGCEHSCEHEKHMKLYDAAHALVEECAGGERSPSRGALARLESALAVEWSCGLREDRMKVYWSVEGTGCQFRQCGNKMRLLAIDDEELEGLAPEERSKRIDNIVADEFDRTVYPVWEEKDEEE